jgi:integrase
VPRARKPTWPPLPRRPRGSGSLQRLADGRLRARLPATVDPKRTAREFPADALAEAVAWLDAHLRAADGRHGHTSATTVEDWSGYWWETFIDGVHPPNTARFYLYALRKLESLYAVTLAELRTSRLQAIVKQMALALSPATIAPILVAWRRCFEAAIDDELLTRNPVRGLTFDTGARTPAERRSLTAKELGLLRAGIAGHRFEAAYVLILEMGLRFGEAHGLHWANVDFGGRRIWVADQYTNGHWRKLPKGKNPHWAEMPADVARVLMRHRDSQPLGSVLVLQSPHRGRRSKHHAEPMPWSRNTIVHDLQAIVVALKLDYLTPHASRHGLASHWLDNGVSPAEVARRLGHADAGITLRRYVHTTEASTERASELIEALFSGQNPADLGDYLGGSADAPIESASE